MSTFRVQKLQDASNFLKVRLEGEFTDTNNESQVLKIDASTLNFANAQETVHELFIRRISWILSDGVHVELLWHATAPVRAIKMAGNGSFHFPGTNIPNSAGAGKTGDVLLTTAGVSAGAFYDITIEFGKVGPGFTLFPSQATGQ